VRANLAAVASVLSFSLIADTLIEGNDRGLFEGSLWLKKLGKRPAGEAVKMGWFQDTR